MISGLCEDCRILGNDVNDQLPFLMPHVLYNDKTADGIDDVLAAAKTRLLRNDIADCRNGAGHRGNALGIGIVNDGRYDIETVNRGDDDCFDTTDLLGNFFASA